MKTIEIEGRYAVGTVLYLRPGTPYEAQPWDDAKFVAAQVTPEWETVSKGERRTMTAEQIAGLTIVRVVSVRGATNAQRAVADASEGSVGLREVSVCEPSEAPEEVAEMWRAVQDEQDGVYELVAAEMARRQTAS